MSSVLTIHFEETPISYDWECFMFLAVHLGKIATFFA